MKKIYLLSLLTVLVTLVSCYQRKYGCLDPNAVNFDVNADVDTGACNYPNLILELAHVHGTKGLRFDTAYRNALQQPYVLRDVAFYLSGFSFGQGLQEVTLQDTFQAYVRTTPTANDSTRISFTNDIGLIRRSTITLPIGAFRDTGSFDRVLAQFGLRDPLRDVLPGSVRLGHPLRPQPEMLYDSIRRDYRFARILYQRDTLSTTKPDTLWLHAGDFGSGQASINQPVQLRQRAGFDFILKLKIDYALWMRNTDLTKPREEISKQIAREVAESFFFE